MEISDNLSFLQPRTLAQAFYEYGCQVSIVDTNGDHIDVSEKATSSVYDNDGILITKAAAIIGALTLVNRVTSYRRYKKMSLLGRLFVPRYVPVPPKPKYYYKSIFSPIRKLEPIFHPAKPARKAHSIMRQAGYAENTTGEKPLSTPVKCRSFL